MHACIHTYTDMHVYVGTYVQYVCTYVHTYTRIKTDMCINLPMHALELSAR